MSNEDMDREWKPSNRPQSTMARSFSLALNDLFKIDNSLADLDAAVFEKKQAVSSQTSELEALEARLRSTEERLKKANAGSPPGKSSTGRSSPRPRIPLGDTFKDGTAAESAPGTEQPPNPLQQEFHSLRPNTSRPQTKDGWQGEAPMPGALPPTPGASEGDSKSVLLARRPSADGEGKDGDHPPPPETQ